MSGMVFLTFLDRRRLIGDFSDAKGLGFGPRFFWSLFTFFFPGWDCKEYETPKEEIIQFNFCKNKLDNDLVNIKAFFVYPVEA